RFEKTRINCEKDLILLKQINKRESDSIEKEKQTLALEERRLELRERATIVRSLELRNIQMS
ncbi:9414_t:CDS:1, partial [Funneliformis caledonium]